MSLKRKIIQKLRNVKNGIDKNPKVKRLRAKRLHRLIDVKAIVVTPNEENGHNRLDYFVKLLAIEEENGLNDYGWKLLEKMEGRRSAERLREQIKDYVNSNKDTKKGKLELVVMDRFFNIRVGSNSVAIALFYGIPKIECVASLNKVNMRRDGEYLIEKGFSQNEIQLVEDRAREYVEKCDTDFLWILWPTVLNYFDEIMEDIQKECEVTKWRDVSLTSSQLGDLVQDVYALHKIYQPHIDMKISYLLQFPSKIRLIYVRHRYLKFICPGPSDDILLVPNDSIKLKIRDKHNEKIDNFLMGFVHNEDSFEREVKLGEIIDKYCD